MSGDFLGTFENSVNKQRISIPSAFKKKFAASAKQTVVVSLGPDMNVVVYPLDNWSLLMAKLKKGNEHERELLVHLREFANVEQQLEGPGRIRISEDLLTIAGISDKVFIKGEGSFISIWAPDKFQERRLRMLSNHKKSFTTLDYEI